MQQIQTEVLVIGGGATGAGVVRDLAMRGFKTVLVEKGDLTHGTTGRYHGLLHSGGRYVVKDPQAARECIEENRILRKIMPECIEDTGGFFVLTGWDDPDYAAPFLEGCRAAGVPVEEIPVSQMLREEPYLNPRIQRCFRVPDGSADSFQAADLNARSARQYGARILSYHQVKNLLVSKGQVQGAICDDRVGGDEVEIRAEVVVNASGAWAGGIARMAGLQVHVIPGKGTMLAINHRIVNTVINRCKMPSDGDILVPAHTVAVIGTTDVQVADADHFAIEPWEVHLMLEEGEKMIPGFREMRVLRAWAGVRPLYQETSVSDTRDVTRAFVLLDHEPRDGVRGFITITGGKWTTYRKMAEVTVDLVCQKLGVDRPCRTAGEPLPSSAERAVHPAGKAGPQPADRLAEIEKRQAYGNLVCECELAAEPEVVKAILEGSAKTIDDVRRDVRVGMGPCQGGFCTYRVAGLLHRLRPTPVQETNLALRDFLQERWKGLLPILWGQQLRQERLDELIYLSILNADHLPGPATGRLTPELYAPPEMAAPPRPVEQAQTVKEPSPQPSLKESQAKGADLDLLIVGSGLAGLSCAYQAASRGLRVRLISKGWGALYWQPGCIDVLGYDPRQPNQWLASPLSGLAGLKNPHPYARLGAETIRDALEALKEVCAAAGYPMRGSLESNWLLPTAVGAMRPTCLAPETMIAGDLRSKNPLVVVGFEGFPDFYPELIADNLDQQGVPARGLRLALPGLSERRFVNPRTLASLFEKPEFCAAVGRELKRRLAEITGFQPARAGFPAVLGLSDPLRVKTQLEASLGLPIFEIPGLPPSIPGMRLSRILVRAIEERGGRVYDGMQVGAAQVEAGKLLAVWSEAASRQKAHPAKAFVLATGGLLGGGLRAEYEGAVRELACGLPVQAPPDRRAWLNRQFLSSEAHPIYRAGLQTDGNFHPLGLDGKTFLDNVYVAGNLLAGFDSIQDRSHEGVALATGYFIGKIV